MAAQTIAIATHKGGTGKTVTAMAVGAALARAGQRCLLVDLDPQGHSTLGLGMEIDDTEPTLRDFFVYIRAPHHSYLPIRKKVLSKKSWYNIAHGKYSATTHLHLGVCTGQRQERHALFPTDSGADEAGLYQAQVGGQLLAGTTRVPGATRSGPEGTSRNALSSGARPEPTPLRDQERSICACRRQR